ncbi:hypothetical protein PWT90_08767 [Aphanocladium album]|nr:hypothetical protein PWT90_08767 [Aphanocladium album]
MPRLKHKTLVADTIDQCKRRLLGRSRRDDILDYEYHLIADPVEPGTLGIGTFIDVIAMHLELNVSDTVVSYRGVLADGATYSEWATVAPIEPELGEWDYQPTKHQDAKIIARKHARWICVSNAKDDIYGSSFLDRLPRRSDQSWLTRAIFEVHAHVPEVNLTELVAEREREMSSFGGA